MSQDLSTEPYSGWDILGDCLWAAYLFAKSSFDTELQVYDTVNLDHVLAGTMFESKGRQWIMAEGSMLADPAIKAIAVNARNLMIETSPLDAKEVYELIEEYDLPIHVDDISRQGRVLHIESKRKRKVVAFIDVHQKMTRHKEHEELAPRMIWRIPWKKLDENLLREIIRFLDLIYTAYVFDMKGLEEFSVGPQAIEMRQQLELQMRMQMEQTPILCLQASLGLQMQMLPGLQMLIQLQRELLTVESPEDLGAYLVAYQAHYGAKALNKLVIFTLAGKIKAALDSANPGTATWKHARDLAWKVARENGALS